MKRHTILYVKQINSKVLLYSTGNSTQNLVINYNGKESGKEYTYISMNNWNGLMCWPLSHIGLSVTLWTVARQARLSMGFSRHESWSGLPCPPPGESSWCRDRTWASCIGSWFFTTFMPWCPDPWDLRVEPYLSVDWGQLWSPKTMN